MSGETNLDKLLANLQPKLLDGEFVFCTTKDQVDLQRLKPLATFREAEGLSLVLSAQTASDLGLETQARFRCILLSVYSSLEAVGLTAAVTSALTDKGIGANVVAAYHHDYVFVKGEDAEAAMRVLKQMALHH